MDREFNPEEGISPRELFDKFERTSHVISHVGLPRSPVQREFHSTEAHSPDFRTPDPRTVHQIRGRLYRLRSSEISAMVEIGKFHTVAVEDLCKSAYSGHKNRMRPDLESLLRQGLVQMKSVPREDKGPRQLLALTKTGHGLLKGQQAAGEEQILYHGFKKRKEAHHDADLYPLYQKEAEKIKRNGGRNLRVILDYELQKKIYHDLAKLGPDRAMPENMRTTAERHGLQVVRGKIPLPDLRIEYDTPDGERSRVDVELATSHYRLRHLLEKVGAGFSIYAHSSDVPNLRRVLDQRELTAEILSL